MFVAAALVAAPLVATAGPTPLSPREIYKAHAPSVVLVFAATQGGSGSAGTGSIISADGKVITNAHVVAPKGSPSKRIYVYLKPERLRGSSAADLKQRYAARLVARNDDLDLALLRIEKPPRNLAPLQFADSNRVEIGEPVVAIGHPETGGLWTLTTGSISSVVADFGGVPGKDVFQTEASVNRGNSGGPLLNAYGHMVGINTSISRRASDGLAITDINFSLKSSVAKRWLEERRLARVRYADPNEIGPVASVNPPRSPPPAVGGRPDQTAPDGVGATSSEAAGSSETDDGDQSAPTAAVPTPPEDVAPPPPMDSPPPKQVAPPPGRDVADDPEFMAWAQGKKKPDAPLPPKQLTRPRPYEMNDFVRQRLKEIQELEDLIRDSKSRIREKSQSPTKKDPKGLGLW
jgi:serine protease Do